MSLSFSRYAAFGVACVAGVFASTTPAFSQAARLAAPGAGRVVALAPSLFAASARASISGMIRDRAGRPQIGTAVELLNSSYNVIASTFTDDRGRYRLPRLAAGVYQLRASSDLFLPAVHPNLHLIADSRAVVNLTLTTLYQAMQWFPAEPRTPQSAADDWDWTLRLTANRPLLRFLDPAQAAALEQQAERAAEGSVMENAEGIVGDPSASEGLRVRRVAVHSGFNQFGQGGLQQQMILSTGDDATRAFLLEAQTAISALGESRLSTSAAYHQSLSPDRSMVTMLTYTDRPEIQTGSRTAGLTTMHVRSASTIRLGDFAELQAGTDLLAARAGNDPMTLGSHPFGSLAVHLGDSGDTVVSYSLATAPSMTSADRLESEAALDRPGVTESATGLHLEQGMHQELGIEHAFANRTPVGQLSGKVSVFHDSLAHPVVQGLVSGRHGSPSSDTGEVLYDPTNNLIAVSGEGYSGGGVMAMLHDQLSADTWISLRAALSQAAELDGGGPEVAAAPVGNDLVPASPRATVPGFTARQAPLLAVSAGTKVEATGTVVRGGYRWQPYKTLTQVAPFSDAMPDAYLSFSLRQPLHLEKVGSGKIEAIVDVQNLLAQGYRPFLSRDGSTVYFAQAQRCIAAGLAFSF